MRLRTSLIAAITAAGLAITPLALADPLDPDPSFGGDGFVQLSYGGDATAVTAPGRRLYVAGSAMGAGSGESYLSVGLRGRHGRLIRAQGGLLERFTEYPFVADVMSWRHRVFAVGRVANLYNADGQKVPGYGFAAAFPRSLDRHLVWGTDRYATFDETKGDPGLERLREVDFASVTGGAVDAQGRVLVTGRVHGQTAIVRLTRDGHIDRSYGTNGVATIGVGSVSSPRDIAVHGSTALVVGNTTNSRTHQGFAAQITPYGYRDRRFDDDGVRLIGQPLSHAAAVATAETGRWLVAYESAKRAHVIKFGATGSIITTFGKAGHATARCTRPNGLHVINALATHRRHGSVHRIALALSCTRGDQLRRLAAIWRPGGKPITTLRPDGVGRLPWHKPTIDLTYGWRGRIVGLSGERSLIRLR